MGKSKQLSDRNLEKAAGGQIVASAVLEKGKPRGQGFAVVGDTADPTTGKVQSYGIYNTVEEARAAAKDNGVSDKITATNITFLDPLDENGK